MSRAECFPPTSCPIPYALAATDTENAKEASRFHTTNWPCCIFAVPDTRAGVKNTATRPHRE